MFAFPAKAGIHFYAPESVTSMDPGLRRDSAKGAASNSVFSVPPWCINPIVQLRGCGQDGR
jgi:hypothetical protein